MSYWGMCIESDLNGQLYELKLTSWLILFPTALSGEQGRSLSGGLSTAGYFVGLQEERNLPECRYYR